MSNLSDRARTPQPTRPIPKRLFTLQPESLLAVNPTTLRPTPAYTYPSSAFPSQASSSSTFRTPALPPSRPCAPKRSHSFCGDSSTSNYALASANACAHLSADKRKLVAPPLERTLSSIGYQGNPGQPGQQMSRPISRDPLASYPLSPPISPRATKSGSLPRIVISGSTPTRPGLSPVQRSSKASTSSTSLRHGSGRIIRSQSLVSNASSRASSYILTTPIAGTVIPPHYDLSVNHLKSPGTGTKNVGMEFEVGHGKEEEDDMMAVDDMVERIEELAV